MITIEQKVLKMIVESLSISVSNETISQNSKEAISNIYSLSNQLMDWNVNCLAVRITKEQLREIPYPAIAHLKTKSGHFVVLQKSEGNRLVYSDPFVGLVSTSLEDFVKEWTGVLLLLEKTEKSGEEGYDQSAGKRYLSKPVTLYRSV